MQTPRYQASPKEIVAPSELVERMEQALDAQRQSGGIYEFGGWGVLHEGRVAYSEPVRGKNQGTQNPHFFDDAAEALSGTHSLAEQARWTATHTSILMYHVHPRTSGEPIAFPQSAADIKTMVKQPHRRADIVVTEEGAYLLLRTDATVRGNPSKPSQLLTNRDTAATARARSLEELAAFADIYKFHVYFARWPQTRSETMVFELVR